MNKLKIALPRISEIIILAVFVTSCIPIFNGVSGEEMSGEKVKAPITKTATPIAVDIVILMLTPTALPTESPTDPAIPTMDLRPIPYDWREWARVPNLTPRAQSILLSAINNPELDMHTFSKVGDCQMTSGTFLGGFVNGKYHTPSEYIETVEWYADSMAIDTLTAENGLGISSVLIPMFGLAAGYQQCLENETPLDCELRTRKPSIVLIAMGTNWIPNAEISFKRYLRKIVERVLETGALPVLATKADNIEKNWGINQTIAQVAYDYDVPLVNIWLAVQGLPNYGLDPSNNIYLSGDGWMARNYAWLGILEKIRLFIASNTTP
jgi:hypothetical protein